MLLAWHWFACLLFAGEWWRLLLRTGALTATIGLTAAVEAVCVAGYRFPAMILPSAWDGVALSLFVGLGLYDLPFAVVVFAGAAAVFVAHWLRHNWRHDGWMHRLTGTRIRGYLIRYPDARLYLALHAVRRAIWGESDDDPQFERELRALAGSFRLGIECDRLAQSAAALAAGSDPSRSAPASTCPGSGRLHLAGLARYLAATPGRGPASLARLLEAAEIHEALETPALPKARSPASAREIYQWLLDERAADRVDASAARSESSALGIGVLGKWMLRGYAAGLACWAAAPPWLMSLLRGQAPPPCAAVRFDLPEPQRRLLRFLLEPRDDVGGLIDAASDANLSDPVTCRLVWLAVTRWIGGVEAVAGNVCEALIDGQVHLLHALGEVFWDAEIESDPLAWANRARQMSLTCFGVAWLRYRESLRWIPGNATFCNFAWGEAARHLAAGQAAALLDAAPGYQEESIYDGQTIDSREP
jgi:hypothetical protein